MPNLSLEVIIQNQGAQLSDVLVANGSAEEQSNDQPGRRERAPRSTPN